MILDSAAVANLTQSLDFLAASLREAQGQDVDNVPGLRGRLTNAFDGLSRNLEAFRFHGEAAGLIPEEDELLEREPPVEVPGPAELGGGEEAERQNAPAVPPEDLPVVPRDDGGMQTADGVGLS